MERWYKHVVEKTSTMYLVGETIKINTMIHTVKTLTLHVHYVERTKRSKRGFDMLVQDLNLVDECTALFDLPIQDAINKAMIISGDIVVMTYGGEQGRK